MMRAAAMLPAGDEGGLAIQDAAIGSAPPRARAIAVVNQKGGVGKTTTAVNLAASLAAAEHPTLLIDLDPQGNASSAYALRAERPHIYDALLGECALSRACLETELPHLHVAPAGPDLVGAEIELVDIAERESRLRLAIEPVRSAYDFVIIDCPPSLGLLTLNALVAADAVLIPLQCEYYALEGLARLMETVDRVRSLNQGLALEGIVLTMVDLRANLTRQVSDEVKRHFGESVFRSVIPRNVRLSEAPSHGKPILLYDVQSKGAIAYLALAEELLERHPETGPPRKPPSLPPRGVATDNEKESS